MVFDEVKRLGRFDNDAQMAEGLGLTRAQISAWRTGKSDLGTLIKLKLLDALGVENLHSVLQCLYPVRHREDFIRLQARLVERVRQTVDAPNRGEAGTAVVELTVPLSWEDNALLAGLPEDVQAVFAPHMSATFLPAGPVTHRNQDQREVYFPITAVASMSLATGIGATEWAIVGRDGCIDWAAFPGESWLPRQTVVLSEGHAWRLSIEVFRAVLAQSTTVRQRYFQSLQSIAGQLAKTTFCNATHSGLQRLCCWLLHIADRAAAATPIRARPDLIAIQLGGTEHEIIDAITILRAEGAIQWENGAIQILERARVARQVCECAATHLGRHSRAEDNRV